MDKAECEMSSDCGQNRATQCYWFYCGTGGNALSHLDQPECEASKDCGKDSSTQCEWIGGGEGEAGGDEDFPGGIGTKIGVLAGKLGSDKPSQKQKGSGGGSKHDGASKSGGLDKTPAGIPKVNVPIPNAPPEDSDGPPPGCTKKAKNRRPHLRHKG